MGTGSHCRKKQPHTPVTHEQARCLFWRQSDSMEMRIVSDRTYGEKHHWSPFLEK